VSRTEDVAILAPDASNAALLAPEVPDPPESSPARLRANWSSRRLETVVIAPLPNWAILPRTSRSVWRSSVEPSPVSDTVSTTSASASPAPWASDARADSRSIRFSGTTSVNRSVPA
jgi:hypothetical protein